MMRMLSIILIAISASPLLSASKSIPLASMVRRQLYTSEKGNYISYQVRSLNGKYVAFATFYPDAQQYEAVTYHLIAHVFVVKSGAEVIYNQFDVQWKKEQEALGAGLATKVILDEKKL